MVRVVVGGTRAVVASVVVVALEDYRSSVVMVREATPRHAAAIPGCWCRSS